MHAKKFATGLVAASAFVAWLPVVAGVIPHAGSPQIAIVKANAETVELSITHVVGEKTLYVAFGATDGGTDVGAWDQVRRLTDLDFETTRYTWACPVGWGSDIKFARFFIGYGLSGKTVEWIKSSGTQYVKTGCLLKSDTRITYDFQFVTAPTLGLIGGASGSTLAANGSLAFGTRSSKFVVRAAAEDSWNISTTKSGDTSRHTFDVSATGDAIMDGSKIGTASQPNLPGTVPIYIAGAAYLSWSTRADKDDARHSETLYSCSIFEGEKKVRDFVPAVAADGAAGLFDKVEAKFYGNAGNPAAGDFVASTTETGDWIEKMGSNSGTLSSDLGTVIPGSFSRTIETTDKISQDAGSIVLNFGKDYRSFSDELWVAFKKNGKPDEAKDWDAVEMVATIAPGVSSYVYTLPADWGVNIRHMRFFFAEKYYRYFITNHLTGDGVAYIDLGITGKSGDLANFAVCPSAIDNATGVGKKVFGAMQKNKFQQIICASYSGSYVFDYATGGSSGRLSQKLSTDQWYSIILSGTTRKVFVGKYEAGPQFWENTFDLTSQTFETPGTLRLFDVNVGEEPDEWGRAPFAGSIAYLNYRRGGKNIIKLNPARSEITGEAVMYDSCSGCAYRNSASGGSFTVGPDIVGVTNDDLDHPKFPETFADVRLNTGLLLILR